MRFTYAIAVAGLAHQGMSQQSGGTDLSSALSSYPQLSSFSQVLSAYPNIVSSLVPQGLQGVTVLVPSNAAFQKYANRTGTSLAQARQDLLATILQYHILAARMRSSNFTEPRGVTVPTLLKDKQYNNRTAGAKLVNSFGADAAQGNVLFFQKDSGNPGKVLVRQTSGNSTNFGARSGLGESATMDAVDGQWALGYFQIIDSILAPPAPCSNTIRALSSTLSALDNALNRSGLWPILNSSPNVTCLAPNTEAFKMAGRPDASLNTTDLQNALLFHTLTQVTYSNLLQDGDVFKSVAGPDVTVRLVDGDIYFNDARVVAQNVLTNNGLIHVLDRVMSSNGTAPTGTGSPTGGLPAPRPTVSPSGTPTAAPSSGHRLTVTGAAGALLIVLIGAFCL